MIADEVYPRAGGEIIAWGQRSDSQLAPPALGDREDAARRLAAFGRWCVVVRPLMFGRWLFAVSEGASLDEVELDVNYEPATYDRGYEYETKVEALDSLIAFDGGEPLDGWTRAYPPRFRRRPGGDPTKEEVRP